MSARPPVLGAVGLLFAGCSGTLGKFTFYSGRPEIAPSGLPDVPANWPAILVGHAHFDHAMDLPAAREGGCARVSASLTCRVERFTAERPGAGEGRAD